MTNYIPDENKFHLAGPPAWWLRRLWDFDSSLAVLPSRQGFYYRLAQRRRPTLSAAVVNEALFKESDTRMLASYNMVPVTTILATANWSNPEMFEELRKRAPWRQFESAAAAADAVEKQDAAFEAAKQRQIDANLNDVAKDAWGMYNKKIGLRTHMWSPKTATTRR